MLKSSFLLFVLLFPFFACSFDQRVKPKLLKKYKTFEQQVQCRSNSVSIDSAKEFGDVLDHMTRRAPPRYYSNYRGDKLEDDFGYKSRYSKQKKSSRV